VGSEWSLYVATHETALSTPAERGMVLHELARGYRPEFKPLAMTKALRTHKYN
jgi:hypothetical protein